MAKPQEHLGFVPSPPPAESTTRTSHLHVGFEQIQRSPSRMVICLFPSGWELFVVPGRLLFLHSRRRSCCNWRPPDSPAKFCQGWLL